MTPEETEQVQAHIQAIAAILYKNTPTSELTNLETIEKSVRRQVLEQVSPNIALFLPLQVTGVQRGKTRQLKSCVGVLKLKTGQTRRLGVNPGTRLSPLLEKCCLRLSANESYQNAEAEIEALTGVKVSHSTIARRVLRQEIPTPEAKQAVGEVSVDGGKIRLRGNPGEEGYWRDYKAVRLESLYYGAFFQDNQSLIDFVNAQPSRQPLVCLGDGHDGIWNVVSELATPDTRWEIQGLVPPQGESLQGGWVVEAVEAGGESTVAGRR